jgi:hypothetical protein
VAGVTRFLPKWLGALNLPAQPERRKNFKSFPGQAIETIACSACMSLFANRWVLAATTRRSESPGASGPIGSSPVFSLSIVHYPLFIVPHPLSIAFPPQNTPNCDRNHQFTIPYSPFSIPQMIPPMVSLVPVKYRLRRANYRFSTGYDQLSTGKVPVMVGYGKLRKLRGLLHSSNDVLSTKASPVLSEF